MLEFEQNAGSLALHQERFALRTRQPGIDTQGASGRRVRMWFSQRLSNKVAGERR